MSERRSARVLYRDDRKRCMGGCNRLCHTLYCDNCAPPMYENHEAIHLVRDGRGSKRWDGVPIDQRGVGFVSGIN